MRVVHLFITTVSIITLTILPTAARVLPSSPHDHDHDHNNSSLSVLPRGNAANVPSIQDPDFIKIVMDAHWYWRRIHCAQDLRWSNDLATFARNDVQKCTHGVQHDRAGSNLSGTSPSPETRQLWLDFARTAIHGWHEEETQYDYHTHEGRPGYPNNFLHFTQLVWRDSNEVGCAVTDCDGVDGVTFPGRIYCYYYPFGNNVAEGMFGANVWPPVCRDPTAGEMKAQYGF